MRSPGSAPDTSPVEIYLFHLNRPGNRMPNHRTSIQEYIASCRHISGSLLRMSTLHNFLRLTGCLDCSRRHTF